MMAADKKTTSPKKEPESNAPESKPAEAAPAEPAPTPEEVVLLREIRDSLKSSSPR